MAVLCLTRSAYEKVVAGLRKALDTKALLREALSFSSLHAEPGREES